VLRHCAERSDRGFTSGGSGPPKLRRQRRYKQTTQPRPTPRSPTRGSCPSGILEHSSPSARTNIGGGPATVHQFLAADLIDHMHVVIVPLILGRGERLWDGLEGIEARFVIDAVSSPSGGLTSRSPAGNPACTKLAMHLYGEAAPLRAAPPLVTANAQRFSAEQPRAPARPSEIDQSSCWEPLRSMGP